MRHKEEEYFRGGLWKTFGAPQRQKSREGQLSYRSAVSAAPGKNHSFRSGYREMTVVLLLEECFFRRFRGW